MKCCNHNNNDSNNSNGHKNHIHMGHMWMMLLCCGAPIILLAFISLLGTSFPGIKNALVSILSFLCPIMMIAMLPMMFRKNKGEANNHQSHRSSIDQDQQQNYLK